jgi:AAT family amino acid transporter
MIYVIPMILLVMILPFDEANLDESVFAYALTKYGLKWAGTFFNLIVLVSAFSCANSGVYGTVRALYGLASEGLAPAILLRLNRYNVPQIATIVTILPTWVFIFFAYYLGETKFYTMILGMAGFTGTICWGGILASQLMLRWKLRARGYVAKEVLLAQAFGSPVMPAIGLLLIIVVLGMMAFNGELLELFFFSLAWTVDPIALYCILKRFGKIGSVRKLEDDETDFDEKFPEPMVAGGVNPLLAENVQASDS